MSDNLPLEIQAAIIERFPVESLIRFRSVSRSWKSLIDSSRFIIAYHRSNRRRHTEVRHLLVQYDEYCTYTNYSYVSMVDDDSYPLHKVDLTPPLLVYKPYVVSIVGSSHGLLCLRPRYTDDHTDMVFLWNITIRKEVGVVVSNGKDVSSVIGFGVCPETLDPKIVNIFKGNHMESIACIPMQVEVFTLSTGAWRSPYGSSSSSSLPRQTTRFLSSGQVVDGFLYWLATDMITMDGKMVSYNLVISFDLTSEEFGEIDLPDSLAHDQYDENLSISKLKESLVVLERHGVEDKTYFVVWMMEDVVTNTFINLFEIHSPDASIRSVYGFTNCGNALVEILEDVWCNEDDMETSFGVYDPDSKDISYLGKIQYSTVSVYSYMETLLLLDQPDFIIYDKGINYISKPRGKKMGILKHTNKGKMKAIEETTEPFNNMLTEKTDKVKKGIPNLEKWFELEQQNVDIKRKKLELDQQKVGLKNKKLELQKNLLELEQQKTDLKRRTLELEQQKVDLKNKKADLAPLVGDASKMQNCSRHAPSA